MKSFDPLKYRQIIVDRVKNPKTHLCQHRLQEAGGFKLPDPHILQRACWIAMKEIFSLKKFCSEFWLWNRKIFHFGSTSEVQFSYVCGSSGKTKICHDASRPLLYLHFLKLQLTEVESAHWGTKLVEKMHAFAILNLGKPLLTKTDEFSVTFQQIILQNVPYIEGTFDAQSQHVPKKYAI